DQGDLGLVAEDAISGRRQKPLESAPLTVAKVYENLDAIARESGEGSQERKVRLLSDLLGTATPREATYIVRMVVGEMRLGVADREGRPGVQVRRTSGPGPRLADEDRALLAASGEHHRAVPGNRGGPPHRDPGSRRDRRGRSGPGGLEHGRVPPVPGSQPPAGTEDRRRPDGQGIPGDLVLLRLSLARRRGSHPPPLHRTSEGTGRRRRSQRDDSAFHVPRDR